MHFNPDDRHILVITGEREDSLEYANHISRELESLVIIDQKKALGFLGQEFDAVIYDMHNEFDPNAFGAISGTIRCGGFLILLKPKNIPESSLFLSRFNQLLEHSSKVHFLEIDNPKELFLKPSQRKKHTEIYATTDQELTVKAIIKVVTGHRRRPLVITSDRGRGKSAALGIAAAELEQQGINNIIICAPSKKAVEIVVKHAEQENKESNLRFYSPDDLLQQKPNADLVLIDEAAAIPIPILTEFLKHYSRIVFASTQHGYEGSGRGFSINFKKILDREAPDWKNCELNTPIRWQSNDTLEQFTFDALLLNAEATDDSLITDASIDNCQFSLIPKQELLATNNKLKQLFGLLVNAHYQTKPSDLKQLLDDDSTSIFCLESDGNIIAVALVILEGNIETELNADIFAGKRRVYGHLVAQALSSNIGIESAPQLSGERISRIAVHPKLQNKGFGSFLLKQIIERSKADYLSTCYGATETLINFWKKNNFTPVHLGIKRDASSSAHSLTMLYPNNKKGLRLCEQAKTNFSKSFPHLLSDPLNELESEIVFSLLPKLSSININAEDKRILHSFAYDYRGYENCLYLIWQLVITKLVDNNTLNKQEKKILILKILQKNSWKKTVTRMGKSISGKKEALKLIRHAIGKLL